MQEALPYKRWEALRPISTVRPSPDSAGSGSGSSSGSGSGSEDEGHVLLKMVNLVKENSVMVFGKRGCFMCHVVRKLLLGLGVNPPVFEIDDDFNETYLLNSMSNVLTVKGEKNNVNSLQFPLVFFGGKLFGGLDKVMAAHVSGELVPLLKQAGALWL